MKQGTQLDFSGQTIFVGMDVHKRSWKVSIRSEHMELKTFSQEPSAKTLINHLKHNYPSATYKAVYEAGFCGFGYQRELSEAGINCIIVHPADVPTTDKEKQRKSDTVDCRKLGKTLSEGSLEGIFVPGIEGLSKSEGLLWRGPCGALLEPILSVIHDLNCRVLFV